MFELLFLAGKEILLFPESKALIEDYVLLLLDQLLILNTCLCSCNFSINLSKHIRMYNICRTLTPPRCTLCRWLWMWCSGSTPPFCAQSCLWVPSPSICPHRENSTTPGCTHPTYPGGLGCQNVQASRQSRPPRAWLGRICLGQ